jgi:ParB/RepB/Spo0J family partition protein
VSLAGVKRELREIPLGLIDEPALPSRSTMNEQKMDALVASMRADGFTSAMQLVRVGDRFEVISGHRRWHAARRAGIVAVNAIVYPEKTPDLVALQFGENEYSEDLSPTDEAIWFAEQLEREPELGTDGLAARIRVPRDRVERRLALLGGDEEVFRAVEEEWIGVGVAEQLNKVTQQEFRRNFLNDAKRNGATVAIAAGWVAEWKRTLEPATRGVFGASAPAVASPPRIDPYFTCKACASTEHPEHMRPLQVHEYCYQAMVEPALKFWRHKSDYVELPRTDAEALALIDALIDRFPSIGKDHASAG